MTTATPRQHRITDRIYAEDHSLDQPGTQYLLRLRATDQRLAYHVPVFPLVRVTAEQAAECTAALGQWGDTGVWELLSREGRPRGFVARPEDAGVPVRRRGLHLLRAFLDWQLDEDRERSAGEYGLARYGGIILTAPEMKPENDFDGYNAAFQVPAGQRAPSGYQLRPYGQPDAPARMAWAPAHAMITDSASVLWFPDADVDDPAD